MVVEVYEIEENIPKVIAFPTDNKIRVVWAYGTLLHNRNNESNIAKVEVLLKEIDENSNLKHLPPLIIKVEFTEMDIVRQGTIWRGRHRLDGIWKYYEDYKENVEFRFDFLSNIPEYIKYKNIEQNDTIKKFDFGHIPNFLGRPYHFSNSIYTKLMTNTGTIVLIHGLEFLTSTYVPQEKNIRGKLLNKQIDSILDEYIEEDSFVEDDKYYMHFKENKRLANNVFLSYAKYNQTTRIRLSKLRTSLESGSKFDDRYPIVLPYHPGKMKIIADGIWLDQERFLVLRIKGCSLPKENVLKIKKIKEEQTDKTVTNKVETEGKDEDLNEGNSTKDNENGEQNASQYVDPSDIDVDSGKRPHSRNPSLPIVSEVEILDEDDVEVSYVEEVKQKDHYVYKTEYIPKKQDSDGEESLKNSKNNKENKVDSVSSGDISQSEKDKGTTSFEVLDNIEKSEILILVAKALQDMKKKKVAIDTSGKIYINQLSYLNEVCLESNTDQRPKFYNFVNTDIKTEKSWSIIKNKKKEKDYRRFMLIKIELNNGRCAYLLEIDRRMGSESFSGYMFNYFNGEISKKRLKNLIKKIIQNRGAFSTLDRKSHKMIDIKYPVDIQKLFTHQKIKKSMYEKIKKVIKDAYLENLFH